MRRKTRIDHCQVVNLIQLRRHLTSKVWSKTLVKDVELLSQNCASKDACFITSANRCLASLYKPMHWTFQVAKVGHHWATKDEWKVVKLSNSTNCCMKPVFKSWTDRRLVVRLAQVHCLSTSPALYLFVWNDDRLLLCPKWNKATVGTTQTSEISIKYQLLIVSID